MLNQVDPQLRINQIVARFQNLVFRLSNGNHSFNSAFKSNLRLLKVKFRTIVVGPVVTSWDTALVKFGFLKLDIDLQNNLLSGLQVIYAKVARLAFTPHKVFLSLKFKFAFARLYDMTAKLFKSISL